MIKVLYHSVHEILEYDDIRMLRAAGCEVCSLGAYATPQLNGTTFRGAIAGIFSQDHWDALVASGSYVNGSEVKLYPDFVNRFDVVIFNQSSHALVSNLGACEKVSVVYRSLGQSSFISEAEIASVADRITIVRYSENEKHPGFPDADAYIRFGKSLDDYKPWVGGGDLITFMNFVARDVARPALAGYLEIMEGTNYKLYGANNEGVKNAMGLAPASEQGDIYRQARAYVYIHSLVASYTLNFMEAMLTGVPIIAPSRSFVSQGGYQNWWPERYEVEDLLADDVGMVYSSIDEARDIIRSLPERDLASMSQRARARAADLFDVRKVASQWAELLHRIT